MAYIRGALCMIKNKSLPSLNHVYCSTKGEAYFRENTVLVEQLNTFNVDFYLLIRSFNEAFMVEDVQSLINRYHNITTVVLTQSYSKLTNSL